MSAILRFPAAQQVRTPTIMELRPDWLRDRRADGRRRGGVESYDDVLLRWVVFCGDIPVREISEHMIKDYKRDLMSRVAPGTARHALTVVRAFLGWCVAEGYLTENVALRVPHPRVTLPDPDPLSGAEVQALLAALDRPPTGTGRATYRRNRRAICLMLYAGLRIAEVAGLEWRDIDLIRLEITVRAEIAKGGKARMVPICDELAAELQLARWCHPSFAVVDQGDTRMQRGKALETKSLAHVFERWLPRRGIHIHAHQLRKTFATELYIRGEDLATIQRLLGHSDPKTTMRYIGASAKKEREAVAKLTFRADMHSTQDISKNSDKQQ